MQNPSPFGVRFAHTPQAHRPCHSRGEASQSNPLCSCNGETAFRKPGRRKDSGSSFFSGTYAMAHQTPTVVVRGAMCLPYGTPSPAICKPLLQRRFYFRGQRTVRGGGFGAQTRWRRRDRYSRGACLLRGAVPPGAGRFGAANETSARCAPQNTSAPRRAFVMTNKLSFPFRC